MQSHNVINFDMIHACCKGSLPTKSVRKYKTVRKEDFKSYPEKEKQESINSCTRVNKTDFFTLISILQRNIDFYIFQSLKNL